MHKNKEPIMDIRITKSEIHSTASKDLNVEQDLLQQDQNLQETLKAYEKTTEKEANTEQS
jgi:hypothetical protein